MIVRISGEGQYRIDDAVLDELNTIDSDLDEDLRAGNTERFAEHLDALHGVVRRAGTRLDDDEILPSDIVLPGPGSSLDDVLAMMSEEGLVPDHG